MKSQEILHRPVRYLRPRIARWRRGGSVLELAVCGILLSMILLGAIEGGRYFWVKTVMTNAARDGCRNGILAYQAGTSSGGTSGPQGSYTSILGVIAAQLEAAGLIPSSTTIPSTAASSYALGNFTVYFYDYAGLTTNYTSITDPNGHMSVGDGLEVVITCNWSTEGSIFHNSSFHLMSNNHVIYTSCAMRKEAL
jgi:hypothetical protein